MDTLHGMILIAATRNGQHTIDHRSAIKLPAALRRWPGTECSPRLVLAAAIPDQVMVVHPAAVVATLLATHYTDLIQTNQAHAGPSPADRDSPWPPNFGYGIARAYAGHTDNTGPATTTYIKASPQEVAAALATMTGQPHPPAQP
jgi:hypothetical protein